MSVVLVLVLSFIGSFIQSITGFGYGLFVMSFFPLFLSAISASAVTNIVSLIIAIAIIMKYHKAIQYRVIVFPMIFFMISNSIAIKFSVICADSIMKRLLGVFLVLLSIYFIFFSDKVKIKANWFSGAVAGGLGGIANGLFSIGGPPVVIYFLTAIKNNVQYIATIQFYFACSSFYSLIMRIVNGAINMEVIKLSIPASIGMGLGVWIGVRIFEKLSAQWLRKCVYIFMFFSGAWIAITG